MFRRKLCKESLHLALRLLGAVAARGRMMHMHRKVTKHHSVQIAAMADGRPVDPPSKRVPAVVERAQSGQNVRHDR